MKKCNTSHFGSLVSTKNFFCGTNKNVLNSETHNMFFFIIQ